jgi:hypothetical protein
MMKSTLMKVQWCGVLEINVGTSIVGGSNIDLSIEKRAFTTRDEEQYEGEYSG